ncbi:fumarylacetoacetate hydrolase family protein [uncultured Roseobacter sp.]|uniref:2-keto-4-pentenoate hydratase n=1 Tax=uncultured Roseobacter sp. TaxID=114847 RepID=UPI002620FD22|nr:fumarylacetoacetate hydrolase family protein [uncultured Roseobacter sp.]
MIRAWAWAAVAVVWAGAGQAACASDEEIARYVADYTRLTPAKALAVGASMEEARCTQAKLAAALEPVMGPVVGYKAGLTSAPAQERFGVTEPVQGVLYEKSLLPDGASVPLTFGARPVFEADLLLVVGDAALNEATSTEEAMQHIAAVRPFIELPDLMLDPDQPFTAATLTAIGVGPRLGVMGAEIPVDDPAAMHAALGNMTVRLAAADGEVLAEVPGKAVLGHPVQSALWLMSKGITFQPGDVISVGSFGPLVPPAKGKGGAQASYIGLPGDPSVSVTFTE